MKINYIKTIGFRKFKNVFETNLYDTTSISGKNRSGKSNVLYAIINTILNTNLTGDDSCCLINNKCDNSYGELHFTDNAGVEHTLVRGKNRYNNNKNFLILDGKPTNQKELTSYYKDKKLFLSIVNPLYFLSKKPAEQKALIDQYLSAICPEDLMATVYNQLPEDERKLLEEIPEDIPKFISDLNEDIKRYKNAITSLDGKIEYAQNIVNEKLPNKKTFDKEEELTLARQELAFLNTNQDIVDKEAIKKEITRLENEILSKETEFNETQLSMKTGKKKYLEIKTSESPKCPVCEQSIENDSKKKTIENMYNTLMLEYNKRNMLEAQIKDLKIDLTRNKCKYHSLDGDVTVQKSKRIAIAEENIKQLENEKAEIEQFNNEITLKEKNVLNAKQDIDKFNADKKLKNKGIDDLSKAIKIAQKLYISYIEEKLKLAKQYLKDVDIRFYTVLKTTGEIKEDFVITYKNQPLSDLSRSETIATALEFANMFNKISNSNFPIFIDDYESCVDYDFIKDYADSTQIFIAKVEKGNLLKIADYNNKNNYTIIKPVISGCKTMSINNNVAIKKAA